MNHKEYEQWDGEVYTGNYQFDLDKVFKMVTTQPPGANRMSRDIKELIDFYQKEYDVAEENYNGDDAGWDKIIYLSNIVDRLHDVQMYLDWIEEEKA